MSVSISGGASVGVGLTPVFGFTASGGIAIAPPPAVLQFPGVPALTGGFGVSLGISGGGVDVNASAGIGGGFAGISGGLSVGPEGISGSLSGGIGPLSGGISIGPGGISAGVGLSAFGLSLSASLGPLLTADVPGGMFLGPQWGIFDANGEAVAAWENVTKVEYKHEFRVADFPVEGGRFASYNKVQVPFDARISFSVGSRSGLPGRMDFLVALEQAVASLDPYTVVTPEAVYYQANLTHMEYSRESRRGVNLLVADVWVQEIRVPTGTTVTDPQSPTSEPPVNSGQTQAEPVGDPEGGPIPAVPAPVGDPEGGPVPMPAVGDPEGTPPPSMPSESAPPAGAGADASGGESLI